MTATNAMYTLVSEPNRDMARILAVTAAGNGTPDEIRINASHRFVATWLAGATVFEQDATNIQVRKVPISDRVDEDIERLELAIRQGSANALPDHNSRNDSAMPSFADEKIIHDDSGEDVEFLDLGSRFQTYNTG